MRRRKKLLNGLIALITSYLLLVMVVGGMYLVVPPVSTLMLARLATWQGVTYHPVPIRRISHHLVRAVTRAEDSRFCTHYGVDWNSMAETIEEGGMDGPSRGASTIPMQVAKNLFLWPQQSYIRKVFEVPIAIYLSAIWPKARMMEVYLSIAEWGEGIYGAEAASQTYFHKSAAELSRQEAALLAAALPNPLERRPDHPSGYYAGYAKNLLKWANADVDISCVVKH